MTIDEKIIRKKMIDKGMTFNELAAAVGISRQYLWMIVTGKNKAPKIRRKIYEVLERGKNESI